MGGITITQIWQMAGVALAAIVLLGNAAEKIVKAIKAVKEPNSRQNERIEALELWREDVDRKLRNDSERFGELDTGNRVVQRALLALLDHGIDGNNLDQMRSAKEDLQNHLINR